MMNVNYTTTSNFENNFQFNSILKKKVHDISEKKSNL